MAWQPRLALVAALCALAAGRAAARAFVAPAPRGAPPRAGPPAAGPRAQARPPAAGPAGAAAAAAAAGAALGLCLALLAPAAWAAPAPAPAKACVDLETATSSDLEAGLKGVGPALSKKIIAYRAAERTKATKEGRKTWNFQNWATLMQVDGIGQKICEDNISTACFSGTVQKACPKPK